MSTVAELITLIDALYPNAATSATKISYMNLAQNEISPFVGLIAEDSTLNTVANDDSYALPTGISDISQIESLDVYNSAPDLDRIVESANMKVGTYTIANQPYKPVRISVTHITAGSADTLGTITVAGTVDGESTTEVITPVADSTVYGDKYFDANGITSITGADWVTDGTADSITVGISQDRYDFTRYEKAYIDDARPISNSYYQVYTSAGVKSLVLYPAPTVTGKNIRIRYMKALTALSASATTATPDFDSRFHDMLAYFAAYKLCSAGANPDKDRANYYADEYDRRLTDLWKFYLDKDKQSLKKRRDNRQWH